MTDDRIALQDFLEKSSDASLLREMIGFAAQRLMALLTDALCGAGYGERTAERIRQNDEWAVQRRCMSLETLRLRRQNATSACLPWQPDHAANACSGASLLQHALGHDLGTRSKELRPAQSQAEPARVSA
jgi:hypothetical protein